MTVMTFLTNHSWWVCLFACLLACIPAVIVTKNWSSKPNEEKNRLLPVLEMVLAWAVPVVAAVAWYSADLSAKRDLEEVKKSADVLREYGDMAVLNGTGLPFKLGGGIRFDTPLSEALAGLYVTEGEKLNYKLGQDYEPKYEKIITDFPRFPFTYCALAESLKQRNDPRWRHIAEQGVEILCNTTTIQGHDRGQDDALRVLRDYLEQDKREKKALAELSRVSWTN